MMVRIDVLNFQGLDVAFRSQQLDRRLLQGYDDDQRQYRREDDRPENQRLGGGTHRCVRAANVNHDCRRGLLTNTRSNHFTGRAEPQSQQNKV